MTAGRRGSSAWSPPCWCGSSARGSTCRCWPVAAADRGRTGPGRGAELWRLLEKLVPELQARVLGLRRPRSFRHPVRADAGHESHRERSFSRPSRRCGRSAARVGAAAILLADEGAVDHVRDLPRRVLHDRHKRGRRRAADRRPLPLGRAVDGASNWICSGGSSCRARCRRSSPAPRSAWASPGRWSWPRR